MEEQRLGIEVISGGIIIYPISINNADAFYKLLERNSEELGIYATAFMNSIRNLYTDHIHINDRLTEHIKNKQFYFGIVTTYGHLIGCMGIYKIDWRLPKADLFYFIEGGYPGVGILTHSFNWFITYCFSRLHMDKLGININTANLTLYKVAIKSGFRKEIVGIDKFYDSNMNYYGLWRIQHI